MLGGKSYKMINWNIKFNSQNGHNIGEIGMNLGRSTVT